MENKRTILNSLLLLGAAFFFVLAVMFLLGLGWNVDELMFTLSAISGGIGFIFFAWWIIKAITYLYKELEQLKKGE